MIWISIHGVYETNYEMSNELRLNFWKKKEKLENVSLAIFAPFS